MKVFGKADILIPTGIDFSKWSVVACDQYTSQPEYWRKTAELTNGAPSALDIVFPEAFLGEGDARIEKINAKMAEYLENGIFEEYLSSMIYVERTMSDGRVRRGIVGEVDLEEYDFARGSKSRIRATEETVLERIPPRVKIRTDAPLEIPHIMLLIDDPEKSVIERCEKGEKIYDFDLMQKSGHLTGWLLPDGEADRALDALEALGNGGGNEMLFAVGDGNHSLATAKACWENIKKNLSEEERESHPARFCLVEVVNIHDPSLDFEPIHRVLFDVNPEEVISEFMSYYPEAAEEDCGGQHIAYAYGDKEGDLYVKNPPCALAVGTLQKFIDEKGYKVDYIHGAEVARGLAARGGSIAFLLPSMKKSELFPSVTADGALPRKTFSMGEAADKRFYLEAKKIK